MDLKEIVATKIAMKKQEKNKINRVAKVNKKAAEEEDLDVKLKVQKNKPAGLDTSSPKSLPESIRPLMTDLKDKITTLKETEAELANTKAGLDAQYQKAKDESKIVEKQAEIENLTTNIGKLLFAAKNETFQFQDNLVALTHQVKTVPAKATDKWKFEKVFAKLEELMGKDNAQKFLENTLNGLQSQATEKTITELNIFSPTQKQMKQSDTSDTNKFIDALKEIYVNLRNYYLDVKKANNIIETELATGATASKKNNVVKTSKHQDLLQQDLDKATEAAKRIVKEINDNLENFGTLTMFDLIIKLKEQDMEIGNIRENLGKKIREDSLTASKKQVVSKKAADNNQEVKIFLTNLGKYNEGELVGEWVTLPVQDFKPILERIGIDGKNYEEVFITDYEAPFEIEEYDNINELNNKVKRIEALDEEQKDIIYSLMDEWDFDELLEKVENGDYHYIPQGSITNAIGEKEASNIDLAYGYIDQLGGFAALSPKTIEDYFDYDSYGETLSYDFQTTNKGYVEIY